MSTQKMKSFRSTTVGMLTLSLLMSGCAITGSGSTPPAAESSVEKNYQGALKIGDTAREEGELEKAAESYSRAARWMPEETWPLIQLADTLWEMKNPTESARVLSRAYDLDKNNAMVLRKLGRAYVALNEPSNAQKAYLAALAIEPNDLRTLNGMAIACDLAGEHDTAQRNYREALRLKPNDAETLNNLAYSLISSRDLDEAVSILETLVNQPDATPRQRQNLALAYGLLGREDDVRRVASTDLTPAEIAKNLEVYRSLREEPQRPETLRSIGRPTFASGGLTTDPHEEPLTAPLATAELAEQSYVLEPVAEEQTPAADTETSEPVEAIHTEDVVVTEPVSQKPATAAPAPVAQSAPQSPITLHSVDNTAAEEPVILGRASQDPLTSPATSTTVAVASPQTTAPAEPEATPVQPATSPLGFGSGRVFLGTFDNEAAAREAWIRIWVTNSAALGNMAANIEPRDGKSYLFAVGASDQQQSAKVCEALRQNGVTCQLP